MTDFVFVLLAGVVLLGAFLAVWLRNVFYNALSLILCLFGVAGLFIFLRSEFLAVIEVIIYIGAIAIAIIFAIMLSQPQFMAREPRDSAKIGRGLVIAGSLFAALRAAFARTTWPSADAQGDYGLRPIGEALLSKQVLPFEAVSLVLLVAIIGALVLSRKEDA